MTDAERKEFFRAHRTCVFGYNRKNHGSSMSIVYYMVDGEEILISTMAERSKAKAVRRNLRPARYVDVHRALGKLGFSSFSVGDRLQR